MQVTAMHALLLDCSSTFAWCKRWALHAECEQQELASKAAQAQREADAASARASDLASQVDSLHARVADLQATTSTEHSEMLARHQTQLEEVHAVHAHAVSELQAAHDRTHAQLAAALADNGCLQAKVQAAEEAAESHAQAAAQADARAQAYEVDVQARPCSRLAAEGCSFTGLIPTQTWLMTLITHWSTCAVVQEQYAQARTTMQTQVKHVQQEFEDYQAAKTQEIAALDSRIRSMIQNGSVGVSEAGPAPALHGPSPTRNATGASTRGVAERKASPAPRSAGRLGTGVRKSKKPAKSSPAKSIAAQAQPTHEVRAELGH
jgi:hypothetical protein